MPQFSATTIATSHIFRVLKAIGTVSNYASVTISDQGLKFTVDIKSNACQAHLFLTTQLFSNYEYTEGEDEFTSFNISLTALTSCLQMFSEDGPPTVSSNGVGPPGPNGGQQLPLTISHSCRFIYEGRGHALKVVFKEGTMTTKCELTTYEVGEFETISLQVDKIDTKIIIKGEIMLDALKELDSLGTDIVTIRTSLHAPHFVMTSRGQVEDSQLSFPNEKSVLETFIVERDSVVNNYHFNLISKSMEAVRLATRVSLRCDENGVMSIQSMCEAGDGRQSFVDFRFLSCEG